MPREEAPSWIVPMIIAITVIFACGGTTTTGTKRHVDVGNGGDASVGGSNFLPIQTGGVSEFGGAISSGGGGTGGGTGMGGTIAAGGVAGSGGSAGPGCCRRGLDCGDEEQCVNGVCKPMVPGHCWKNAECGDAGSCIGAVVCECATQCKQGDTPGVCRRAADAGTVSADSSVAPVDCANSAMCPSEWCDRVCCPGGPECALCCVPKSCTSFDAAHCPLDGCQLLPTCNGTSVCYPFFTAPPPTCGGLGYYGGHAPCCSGAVLRCGLPRSDGSCDLTVGGYNDFPMCIECGDGSCDTRFENRCSCPEDCQ